jgi:beta-glucosidase
VVLVVGDDIPFIGEGHSTATLELPGAQRQLIDAVAASGVPFVLALVHSKPMVLPASAERANAVVECFNPGMRGGTAFAELLCGDINPSGKLTISVPRHVGQQPVFYNQIPAQHGKDYADLTQEPRYRFGRGLSYTRYEYQNLRVFTLRLKDGEPVRASVDVSNTGARAGVEIVQVYLHDVVASVTWPDKKLVDFARVALAPGETKTVSFSIPFERLSLVDAFEKVVVEPGEFELRVGPSSEESALLRARFTLEGQAFSFSRIPGVARS